MLPLRPGQTLSHYRIVRQIGAGGMGAVFLAEDSSLERRVALKVLPVELAADPARRERFEREAKAVAALNHPHIVTVHSVEEDEGVRFITMELVEGESLASWVRPGGLPIAKLLEVGIALADALAAAHEKGIVHRDLKPANVMITYDGRVKVLDFGLAKLRGGGLFGASDDTPTCTRAPTLTGDGVMVGTVGYMSPEQLQGLPVDHRTDLFSLGIVLFELAVGERPFVGGSAAAVASSILRDTPPRLDELRADVPSALARIVAHCLDKEVRDRYQSALELRSDLRSADGAEAGRPADGVGASSGRVVQDAAGGRSAARANPASRGERPRRARRWSVASAAAFLVALAAVSVWLAIGQWRRTSRSAATPERPASVAVMPFADLSPGRDQEYFTLGLADELLQSLARLPDLRVAGYKRQTREPQEVGRQLRVSTVLEGSVRKAGNRVRISVQLVKVADGYQLWAETYDRALDDIFAVQDEIARAVASALQVKLLGPKDAHAGTGNPEAYNLMLQAQYLRTKGGREQYDTALELLQRAAAVDPRNARVLAEMSRVYFSRANEGLTSAADYGEAWKAATRAVELDPGVADGHLVVGWFNMTKNWDWSAADASFKKALALEPRNGRALRSAAALAGTLGRFDEAIALGQRAIDLDPANGSIYYNVGIHLRRAGQLDAALIMGRRALELIPDYSGGHFQVGAVQLLRGRPDDALREFEQETDEMQRLRGLAMVHYTSGPVADSDRCLRDLIARYREGGAREIAQVYAWRNEKDKAFEWLDRAYAQRDPGLAELKGEPLFRNLEGDPRYAAFLTEKMHLPR